MKIGRSECIGTDRRTGAGIAATAAREAPPATVVRRNARRERICLLMSSPTYFDEEDGKPSL